MILQANGKITANRIIEENGFKDISPNMIYTHKTFIKDGEKYRFVGWCNLKNREYTAVEMEKI